MKPTPDIHRCWSCIGFAMGTLRWFATHGDLTESERAQSQEAYNELQELFEVLREYFSS